MPRARSTGFLVCAFLSLTPQPTLAANALELVRSSLPLPGPVVDVLPADLDGDGRRDLAVVVAYTRWSQLSITESVEIDEIDGLVESLTIVPALFEKRELHFFLADPSRPGTFQALKNVLELGEDVVGAVAGPSDLPILVLTDSGVATIRFEGQGAEAVPKLEAIIQEPPVLAGTRSFVPRLELMHDLDLDGRLDLLLPARQDAAIFLNGPAGLSRTATFRVALPTDDRRSRGAALLRRYPLPTVADVDGDRLPDLLFPGHSRRWNSFWVARNIGRGRFAAAHGPIENKAARDKEEVVFFGDLDGDGRAEFVTSESLETEDAGLRKGLQEAREPPHRLRFFRSQADLSIAATPFHEFHAKGYFFEGGGGSDEGFQIPGGLQDLDGDGRLDLIAIQLDFSVLQAVRILAVKSISIGMDFVVHCQEKSGGFRKVPDLDLSGKFRLDLNNLTLGRLSLFAGDFDADGKSDFLQLGRGKKLTIHRGRAGCAYPSTPDLTVELEEEPRNLGLVRVVELDGDGRADFWVVQPEKSGEVGLSPRTRLEVYVSGGAR